MQKNNSRIFGVACILVAVVFVSSLIGYSSFIGASSEKSPEATYHRLYGYTPVVGGNYSFTPPISLYRALNLALASDGWNQSSLTNMTIYTTLSYEVFYTNVTALNQIAAQENLTLIGHPTDFNQTVNGYESIHEVTAPVPNYQPQFYNGVSLRYIWSIAIEKDSGMTIPPWGYYMVDAATGELIPPGILI